jgi:hypothetical protein
MTTLPGTSVTAKQDFTIEPQATLVNDGMLSFEGNLINLGTPHLTGVLSAEGNDMQMIDGVDSFAASTLIINNAAGVRLGSTLTITEGLTLDRGILFTKSVHPVYFSGHASNPNETVDGYIDGTAIFPEQYISASKFTFLGASITAPAGKEIGMTSIKRVTGTDAVMNIGSETSIAARWDIKNESPDGNKKYDVAFSWLPVFDNDKDLNSLVLYANVNWGTNKFIMLDQKSSYPIKIDAMSGMRTYTRLGVDYIDDRTFTLAGKTAIASTVPEANITTFPNPANDHINFLLENFESWAKDVTIKITDAYGKVYKVETFPLNGNLIQVNDLGVLPTGVYRAFISRGQLTKVVNFFKN